MDGDDACGAVGFCIRENKFYVFKAKAVIVAMGGAVHVFRPRSVGEGLGRSWYPPFNSGSSAYFTIKAGAEMTCQEVRFIPVRFKDAYGPVGAWFLLFKSAATNAFGENYMVDPQGRAQEVGSLRPGQADPGQPAQLPRHDRPLGGQGPALHADRRGHPEDRRRVRGRPQGRQEEAEGTRERGVGRLPRHDHLPGHPLGRQNIEPEEKHSEIAACEPYFIGSHSGASGAWVCGPEDLPATEYFWGYANMTTVEGPVRRGRRLRRLQPQVLLRLPRRGPHRGQGRHQVHRGNKATCRRSDEAAGRDAEGEILAPARDLGEAQQGDHAIPNINPNYIMPRMFMFRLQKIMDEYAGGVSTQFKTNKSLLESGLELMDVAEGRRREARRPRSPRAHELLGEHPPHVAGRGPPPHHPLPRRDPLAGLLLPGRHPRWTRRTGSASSTARSTPHGQIGKCPGRTILHMFKQPGDHELLGG